MAALEEIARDGEVGGGDRRGAGGTAEGDRFRHGLRMGGGEWTGFVLAPRGSPWLRRAGLGLAVGGSYATAMMCRVGWGLALGGWMMVTLAGGGVAAGADETARAGSGGPAQPLKSAELHNLHRMTAWILGGSEPESEGAFAELERLGVRTVISVDGAKPDLDRARRHGMRYVHLPIGYDGISARRVAELVQAVRLAEGVVYVHCHHGKHRGPAAAAVMCAATEGWSEERTRALLEQVGTGKEYPGLYRSVALFREPEAAVLGALGPLPEVAKTSSTVETMVLIDEHWERLKAARASGFREVPGHPDISVRHEVVMLWEGFRELSRLGESVERGGGYQAGLKASEDAVAELRAALEESEPKPARRETAFRRIETGCVECHRAHRNGAR